MKQERILIDFDKESAEKKIQQIERARTNLSKIYKALTEIIGEPVSKEEFLNIFEDSLYNIHVNDSRVRELFISKKIPDGKLGGIPVNLDMIATPDTSAMKSVRLGGDERTLLSHDYLTIENGDIVTSKGYSVRATEEFKIYAETPEELERYQLAKNLSEAWNAVAKTLPDTHFYETLREDNLRTVIDSDDAGVFHPSPYYVKTGEAVKQYAGYASGIQADTKEKGDISDSYVETLLQDSGEDDNKPDYQVEPKPAYIPDLEE